MQLQEIVTHLPHSPPLSCFFFSSSLSLHFFFFAPISLSGSCFFFFLFSFYKQQNLCKQYTNGIWYSVYVVNDVDRGTVAINKSCEMFVSRVFWKEEDAVTITLGFIWNFLFCLLVDLHPDRHTERHNHTFVFKLKLYLSLNLILL